LTLILCFADDSNLICLNLLLTNILLHHCSVFNCIMAPYKFPLLLLLLLLQRVKVISTAAETADVSTKSGCVMVLRTVLLEMMKIPLTAVSRCHFYLYYAVCHFTHLMPITVSEY